MALSKLPYNVDNLDKAKQIVRDNLELLPKGFETKFNNTPDVHWGEKITLANKIIDQINSQGGTEK